MQQWHAEHRLIGRHSEQAILQNSLEDLQRGQGALVLVGGEAGIGKTTLARAFGEQARAFGATFATGRCHERGSAPPFAPWQELLADLQAIGEVDGASLPPPFGQGPEAQTAYQVMQSVVSLLHQAAGRRPLIVLLDDIHWADRDTIELLDLTTRRLDRIPLLLITTYRVDEVHRRHPLYHLLPDLQRDRTVQTLTLGPLREEDVARYVEAQAKRCSSALARYLHIRSDGNPLFLVELLRHLLEQDALPHDDQGTLLPPEHAPAVPDRLQQIVSRRASSLGSDAEALLEVAAVVGEEWDLGVVEAVLEWPEAQLLRALERALSNGLVVPASDRAERYRFAHSLFREVIYRGPLARRRRRLHERIAAVLDAARAPLRNEAALAYHYAAAHRWEKAAQAAVDAGDAARDRFAGHTALGHYQAARAALEHVSGSATSTQGIDIAQRLGHAHLVLNQLPEAEAAFEALLDHGRLARDRMVEAHARCWLSYVRTRAYNVQAAHADADAALRLARGLDDPRLLAVAHWNLGHVRKIAGDLEAAWQHLREAERLARQSHDLDVLGWCLQNLAQLAVWEGQYQTAELLASEALGLARACRDALYLGGACFILGIARGELGRYSQALQVLQTGIDHATDSGERHYLVRLLNTTGWVYGEAGDPHAALHWDQRSLDAARGEGAVTRRDSGKSAPVAAIAPRPVTEAERYSLLNLVTDHLAAGNLNDAESTLQQFEALLDQSPYARFRYANRYHLLRGEMSLIRGAHTEALHWAEEAHRLATAKQARKNVAKAHLLAGRALLTCGRPAEAISRLRQTLGLADSLEHGSLRWQARLRLGQTYAAMGRQEEAAELVGQALDHVRTLAAGIDDATLRRTFLASPAVQELKDDLRRPTAHEDTSTPQENATIPAGLTVREVEVLRLVAQGATNAAIAETLVISVKTVNSHVTNILRKTNTANRAAATAFALQHGLV